MNSDNHTRLSDALLAKARARDVDAVADICELYYPRILKFMVYRVNREDAQDLTNDVFVKVVRSIGEQHGRFDPWIYRIARNVTIDYYRRQQHRAEMPLAENENLAMAEKVASSSDPTAGLDVEAALEVLNDEQREVVVLRFIQGFSCEETAEITGKTSGAVRAMQFRALKTLKEAMET